MTYTTEMRLVDIADEAFGLGPVEPVDETLSRIEQGIAQQRQRIRELEREVAALAPVVAASSGNDCRAPGPQPCECCIARGGYQ